MSAEEFKAAMSRWATGVAVVTTNYNNQLFGLTVNSLTSISLSPPLISFCLNKTSGSFTAFKLNQNFAVNILAENQKDIAKQFAVKQLDKFSNIKYYIGALSNSPVIEGVICHLECTKLYEYEGGDHIIFVAEVKHSVVNNSLKPLLYFAREYKIIENIKY